MSALVADGCSEAADPGPRSRRVRRRFPQRNQRHSTLAIISQRPLCRAIITQPVLLDLSLCPPRANERRGSRLSRLRDTVRFHQEQFSLVKPQKRLRTLRVGAPAEHIALWLTLLRLCPNHRLRSTEFRIGSCLPCSSFPVSGIGFNGRPIPLFLACLRISRLTSPHAPGFALSTGLFRCH